MELTTQDVQAIKKAAIPEEDVLICPLGDIQYGVPACDVGLLKEHIDRCMQHPNPLFIGMGDYCVPERTKILTRRGFKHQDEVLVGEDVLAYDQEHDLCRWTPLRSVYRAGSLKMYGLKSKSFGMKASANHRWYGTKFGGKHRRKVVKTTSELKSGDRIRVAAEAEGGDHPISPQEAAILGWVLTDGNIKSSPSLSVTISQSKAKYVSEIRSLLGEEWSTGEYAQHRCSHCGEGCGATTFHLPTEKARALLESVEMRDGPGDILRAVSRFSKEARKAMLSAMIHADGSSYASTTVFSQSITANPQVLEVFKMLSTLEGIRLSGRKVRPNGVQDWTLIKSNHVTVSDLKITAEDEEEAWCPVTDLGSWVADLDGQITITGNCDFGSPSNRGMLKGLIEQNKLFDAAEVALENAAEEALDELFEILSPTQGRWLGLIEGHHMWKFGGDNGTTDTRLAEMLGAPYLGHCGIVNLRVGKAKGNNPPPELNILIHHGQGSGMLQSAPLNKLERFVNYWEDIDIVLMGHHHKKVSAKIPRVKPLFLGADRQGVLKERNIILAGTGSFLRGYMLDSERDGRPHGTYVEQKALSPVTLGAITISARVDESRGYRRVLTDVTV